MEKNEKLTLNEIIEDLNKVHNNIGKETTKYYSNVLSDEEIEDTMNNIDGSEIKLEEIINKLVELSKKQGEINMKINTKKHDFEEMYQVGNVIRWINGNIYLVVDHGELDYSLVDLTNNKVYATFDTLENLISELASESDVLLNAEINVF